MLLSTYWLSMSGRMLLRSVFGAFTLMAVAEAWRRWGLEVELATGVPLRGQERELPSPFETPAGPPAPTSATVTFSVLPGERTVVRFKQCLERPELNDCFGVVEKREQGSISVSLAEGALVQGVTAKDVSLVTLEEVEPASVREVLGEQLKVLQAQQGKVLAGKPEGPEGPPSRAGCLRPLARAGEHAGAIQESQGLAGAVAWALSPATSVGEVVLARGWSPGAFGKEVEGAPLGSGLLGPRSGHPAALQGTQGET